jgi:HSP20 family protein
VARRRDVDRLQDELEEFFAEIWRGPLFPLRRPGFRPNVDVFRTEETPDGNPAELTVVADLAGVDPAQVKLVLLDRTLVISGRRERRQPSNRPSYYQLEIDEGSFERRLALPEDVEPDGARAFYERGLLTIVLPIAQRPRRDVKVSIVVRGAR